MALSKKKSSRGRRYQRIVDAVENAILDGKLQPGDQLPPELEFKEQFGTGRGTVREALRVLEEKGVVEIRAGATGGAFVREADPAKLTRHLELLVQTKAISTDHLKEFREIVEPVAASLAAGRVTPDGLHKLEAALADAEAAHDANDPEGFMRGDVAVHVAIAEITGNPLLTAVLKMVHEHVLGTSEEYVLEGDTTLKENLEDLRSLVSAVAGGDTDEATAKAIGHVRKFHGCMKAARGVRS